MRRAGRINNEWETPSGDGGHVFNWEHVICEILMDIRSELRTVRSLAQCGRIPKALDAVRRIDKRLAKKVKLP